MRRTALVGVALLVGLATASPALAQGKAFGGGVTLGATSTSLSGDNVTSSSADWGIEAGLFGMWELGKVIGIAVEGMFVQRNSKDVILTDNPTSPFDLKTTYASVPILLVAGFALGENAEIAIYGGGEVNLYLKCDVKQGDQSATGCDLSSLTTERKSPVYSVPVGAAIGYNFSSGLRLMLDVRYDYGLSDVLKQTDIKQQSFMIMLRGAWRNADVKNQ